MNNSQATTLPLKAWKWYFWFTATIGICILLFADFTDGLVQLFGAVGLYGYIWSIPIANYVVWQLYLLGMTLFFGLNLLKLADPGIAFVMAQNELVGVALLAIVVVNGPLFYALIRYSSKHHPAWTHDA